MAGPWPWSKARTLVRSAAVAVRIFASVMLCALRPYRELWPLKDARLAHDKVNATSPPSHVAGLPCTWWRER